MKMIHLVLVGLILVGFALVARGADYVEDITTYGPTLTGYVEYVENIANAEEQGNALSYLQGLRHMWIFTFAVEGFKEAEETLPGAVSYEDMLQVAAQCVDETTDLVLYDDLRLLEMSPEHGDNYFVVETHDVLLLQCRKWLRNRDGE